MQQPQASFLFDLDGTLVDSVYQHVLAWNEALDAEGIKLSVWRIHRKIGMSGGLLTNMLPRETGLEIDSDRIERRSGSTPRLTFGSRPRSDHFRALMMDSDPRSGLAPHIRDARNIWHRFWLLTREPRAASFKGLRAHSA